MFESCKPKPTRGKKHNNNNNLKNHHRKKLKINNLNLKLDPQRKEREVKTFS